MKPRLFMPALLFLHFLAGSVVAQVQSPGGDTSDALFDPRRVIQIEIRLDPADWHALRISHPLLDGNGDISTTEKGYDYYRGDVVIDGQAMQSVGVRKKGAWGSTASTRPGLKIKFGEYLKGQTFCGLDMVTLNNTINDPTKAQPCMVYSSMRKAAVLAPRANLARVVVNGEDLGVYVHVESIRRPFIQRFFTKPDGDLYEAMNGGDLDTNRMRLFVHKWGKDRSLAHLRTLVNVLEKPGPISLQRLEELVDLDSFVTFWAMEVLLGLHDGYAANQNNYYLYRDAKSGKLHFIPWGADVAFADPGPLPSTVPKSVKATGNLCYRLWELSTVRERYRREMQRLLTEVWNEETMLSELNRITALWNTGAADEAAKSKAQVDAIRRFIGRRRGEVQAELDQPARDWPLPRRERWRPPMEHGVPMQIEGSFSAVIVDAFPANFTDLLGNGSATWHVSIAGQTHERFTRFGAMATTPHQNQGLTIIRLVASDAAEEIRWNQAFAMDPYRARPSTLEIGPFVVQAPLTQTDAKSGKRQVKNPTGTLELLRTSTNLGGTVSGRFKLKATAFGERR